MVITTQPTNVTVCLTEDTIAIFTCIVEDRENLFIGDAGWQIHVGEGSYVPIPVTGRPRHTTNAIIRMNGNIRIITDTLTITNVSSVNDSNARYRCQPLDGVISDVVTLTVLGMYVRILGECMGLWGEPND